MELWVTIGVVLLAVLVGALVPVLFQLRVTLKSAQRFLESTGRRLDRTLDEVSETTQRLNRLGSEFEEGANHAQVFFKSIGELGRSLAEIRELVHTAAAFSGAVAPAVVAAARAIFAHDGAENPRPDPGSDPEYKGETP
jgi:uncharacterized protein YoxC